MPSESLKLVSFCAYLTDTSNTWRSDDWAASNMVKGLKGIPFNGYFELPVKGVRRRFDQNNISQLVARYPRLLAKMIARKVSGAATIVPIPNSHVVDPSTPNFQTLSLAQKVAAESGGQLTAVPALVFNAPQAKSHEGGPRSPYHFENAYKLTRNPTGQIVFLDDVCTTGGHIVGACWKLAASQRDIVLACAFGRTTKEQLSQPIGFREEELDLRRL